MQSLEVNKNQNICALWWRLAIHAASEDPNTDLKTHKMFYTYNNFFSPKWGLTKLFAVILELQRAMAKSNSEMEANWLFLDC